MPPLKNYKGSTFTSKPKLSTAHDQAIKKYVQKAIKRNNLINSNKGYFNYAITQNTLCGNFYITNPLGSITQGDKAGDRKGRQIFLDQLEIQTSFYATNTTAAVWIHYYVWWCDEELTVGPGASAVLNANIVSTLPLVGGSTVMATSTDLLFDPLRCTPVFHKCYAVPSGDATTKSPITHNFKFNFKGRKCTYLADAVSYMEGKNLYVGWIASINNPDGTFNVTSVGNCSVNYITKFRQ